MENYLKTVENVAVGVAMHLNVFRQEKSQNARFQLTLAKNTHFHCILHSIVSSTG